MLQWLARLCLAPCHPCLQPFLVTPALNFQSKTPAHCSNLPLQLATTACHPSSKNHEHVNVLLKLAIIIYSVPGRPALFSMMLTFLQAGFVQRYSANFARLFSPCSWQASPCKCVVSLACLQFATHCKQDWAGSQRTPAQHKAHQMHYSDIFFITLILGCLIAITLFITNCICRTRFARKDFSDKHKIKSHIHRLESYVLGIDRADFKGDLIRTNPMQKTNKSSPAPSNNISPLTSSSESSSACNTTEVST